MSFIAGTDRDAVLLFPASLDEYITAENPVRFIDAFVASLDLSELGFTRAQPAKTGRPGYNPADLLKLYIYGYLNRVRSSRTLERETQRNVEVMWLVKKLQPDHKTIADFRKDNSEAIKRVCREFTLLCRKLELFGRPSAMHRQYAPTARAAGCEDSRKNPNLVAPIAFVLDPAVQPDFTYITSLGQ